MDHKESERAVKYQGKYQEAIPIHNKCSCQLWCAKWPSVGQAEIQIAARLRDHPMARAHGYSRILHCLRSDPSSGARALLNCWGCMDFARAGEPVTAFYTYNFSLVIVGFVDSPFYDVPLHNISINNASILPPVASLNSSINPSTCLACFS